MRLGRYAEAAMRLEQVTRKKPNETVAHLFLAKCRYAMGDYELALAAAKTGLGDEPENPDLLIQCALCADAAGYDEQAYEFAGRLLETEIAHVAIPRGNVMRLFRPIERLFGVSSINALARVNQDRIREYDWAKRYRRKYERRQSDS